MKIALVVHDLHDHGGHSLYTRILADEFSRRHEVAVFANRCERPPDAHWQSHHVRASRSSALATVQTFPLGLRAHEKLLATYDIRHAQGYCGGKPNVVTAHICVAAYLNSLRGITARNRASLKLMAAAEQRFYRRYDGHVIAISQKVARELREFYRFAGSITVVPHGVDAHLFDRSKHATQRAQLRKAWGYNETQTVALYAGDLTKAHAHLRELAKAASEAQFVIVSGSRRYLWSATNVRFLPPTTEHYNGFSTQSNVEVIPIRSYIESGFALPPVQEFEKYITPKTRGILICNPSNPTGYLYSREELNLLRELVKKYDLWLFSDEVYREFCYDGKEYFSALHLEGIEQNVIMLDSISKRYSACGVRIGSLVSRNRDFMAVALKFAQARLSPPGFGQVAAEAAIDTPPEYLKNVLQEYTARRNFLVDSLNAIEGVFCPKPSGAFYCIARLPIDDSDLFCQWLLEKFSLNNETVMLAPATGFYSDPKYGKDEVRIAYVLKIEDLKKALACLEEALKTYPGRKTQKLEFRLSS